MKKLRWTRILITAGLPPEVAITHMRLDLEKERPLLTWLDVYPPSPTPTNHRLAHDAYFPNEMGLSPLPRHPHMDALPWHNYDGLLKQLSSTRGSHYPYETGLGEGETSTLMAGCLSPLPDTHELLIWNHMLALDADFPAPTLGVLQYMDVLQWRNCDGLRFLKHLDNWTWCLLRPP